MRKICSLLLFVALIGVPVLSARAAAGTSPQDGSTVPQGRKPRHRSEGHVRHRGIGRAYGKAGRSAGRGGKRFGKNIAKGKPIKAGRELGKGAGGFGKHTGQGTARVGRKVGHKIKRAVQ